MLNESSRFVCFARSVSGGDDDDDPNPDGIFFFTRSRLPSWLIDGTNERRNRTTHPGDAERDASVDPALHSKTPGKAAIEND